MAHTPLDLQPGCDGGRSVSAYGLATGDAAEIELRALVTRMANRDEGALAELYERTVAKLHGFARRWRVPEALVDEALMDAFFQAWNEADRYDGNKSRVTTWLTMMFRCRLLDTIRRSDVAEPLPAVETTADDQDTAVSALDVVELMEQATAVRQVLEALSPVQRQLVSLAFFSGLSHQEIAAHVAMPLGTVKAHIRRALLRMKVSLEPMGAH